METNTDHWRKNNEQKCYLHLIVREDKQQESVPGKTEKHLNESGQTKMIKNKTLLETAMQWFGHEWLEITQFVLLFHKLSTTFCLLSVITTSILHYTENWHNFSDE